MKISILVSESFRLRVEFFELMVFPLTIGKHSTSKLSFDTISLFFVVLSLADIVNILVSILSKFSPLQLLNDLWG